MAAGGSGGANWCAPYVWVPEEHRLLRPGGSLLVLGHTPLAMACMPVDGSIPCRDTLQRDYFGMHRLPWDETADEPACVEFNLPVSASFNLFRDTGFDVVDFVALQAPAPGAAATSLTLEQQQKLCIARLLPLKPQIILMDEPCSALDARGTAAIERLIAGLKPAYTVVIVTHNMAQARRTSDECIFMLLGEAAAGAGHVRLVEQLDEGGDSPVGRHEPRQLRVARRPVDQQLPVTAGVLPLAGHDPVGLPDRVRSEELQHR